ncbi:hypothetical protein L484_020856 [Morus notabilis]|uniref:Uncharacterized protein n=1 Tax=Morus notabilis TaxID=981085 RepID=W9QGV8_9ROSA|nr:hypothetical protein L484_020856 [Morus notabilis]
MPKELLENGNREQKPRSAVSNQNQQIDSELTSIGLANRIWSGRASKEASKRSVQECRTESSAASPSANTSFSGWFSGEASMTP